MGERNCKNCCCFQLCQWRTTGRRTIRDVGRVTDKKPFKQKVLSTTMELQRNSEPLPSQTTQTDEERPIQVPLLQEADRSVDEKLENSMHYGEIQVSVSAQSNSTVLSPVIKDCNVGSLHISTNVSSDISTTVTTAASLKNIQDKLKVRLKRKSERLGEGLPKRGNHSFLIEVFTDLYITMGEREQLNAEHEVWQIECAYRKNDVEEVAVECTKLFTQDQGCKCVLTKGIAGIGKTVFIQKFILDWTEGHLNEISLIFPLPFRELNLIFNKKLSLKGLIHYFYPETKDITVEDLDGRMLLFIFDGLDECRFPLDFDKNEICCDVEQITSVYILLTNLIIGNLLPNALIWITSRPAAVNLIPAQCDYLMTEIRGFTDLQKEEYFKKRFPDNESLADTIFKHVRSSRSLYIMCHIPVFCWITATTLGTMTEGKNNFETAQTLTQMYTHLLLFQINLMNQKYKGRKDANLTEISELDKEMIIKLGHLAFKHLQEDNLIFSEKDLEECGIDNTVVAKYLGLFTELFKEEIGIYHSKTYCFIHLSVQEYLAALYVHFLYISEGLNALNSEVSKKEEDNKFIQLFGLHKSAVDLALQSKNGHLDLFLRFLLGISLDSTHSLLENLLGKTKCCAKDKEKTLNYIKKENRQNPSAERAINLFHCLNELNDNSLVEEIQNYQQNGSLSSITLNPDQCSALAYILIMSQEVLEDFNLGTFKTTPAGRRRLLPILRFCRKASLHHCKLTTFILEPVLLMVQSPNCLLVELDLGYNKFDDKGVKLICSAIQQPQSYLKVLRLGDCNLTAGCCDHLAALLASGIPDLRELDLRGNDLEDTGVKKLCCGLEAPLCKLEKLGLSGCRVTEEGCASLTSALQANLSRLRELDLSYNNPGQALLSQAGLEKLNVENCGECRNKPGPQKYACWLTLDPNTANNVFQLSQDNRSVRQFGKNAYPEHTERFDCLPQVMCSQGLTGRCYWEVTWDGGPINIALAYKSLFRKGLSNSCCLGLNKNSWCLHHTGDTIIFLHDDRSIALQRCMVSNRRIGVYLDWPNGIIVFYNLAKQTYLLHLEQTSFSEPLYPAFSIRPDYSLFLSKLD